MTMMYKTVCANCGKQMFTYAKNLRGELPIVYCSRKCQGEAKEKKRYVTLSK